MATSLKEFENTLSVSVLRNFVLNFLKCYNCMRMIFLNEQNFVNGFWAHLMTICCKQHFSLMKHGFI
ncbi:hypothetical protein BDFB_010498 [Asbolus verrucosus]|uniref:Uncharacterized protein n=1 Tax=Asbolus verrucosus TaxID=1661398 RepID=A0A482VI19_ASBVE|nr:hypothetical protein BDFB_010498 [Asbolus verrucosus]